MTKAEYKAQKDALKKDMEAEIDEFKKAYRSGLLGMTFFQSETDKIKAKYAVKFDALETAYENPVQSAPAIHYTANPDGTVTSDTILPSTVAATSSGYGTYLLLAAAAGLGAFLWWRRRK